MRVPDRVLTQITDRLDMGEVVGEYVRLAPKGGRLWGLCPFHPEKTPSFSVNPEKGMFYCFGCHTGGSLFSFVMEMEKLSFPEAVRLLAEKAGVELEVDEQGNRDKEAYLELYRRVAGTFHYLLLNHPQAGAARQYLERRAVSGGLIERFQIGYALPNPRWLADFLKGKGYSVEFLSRSGLFSASRSSGLTGLFRDRIVFPIRTTRDEVVGFGGRTLRAGVEPKYLNTPETPYFRKGELLFGAPEVFRRVRSAGAFVIVEGRKLTPPGGRPPRRWPPRQHLARPWRRRRWPHWARRSPCRSCGCSSASPTRDVCYLMPTRPAGGPPSGPSCSRSRPGSASR
jgi:DNA primase